MRSPGHGVSLLALFGATSLWGLFSAGAALSGSGRGGPLVAAGAAVSLLIGSVLSGLDPVREFRSHPGLYLRLGVLEAVNLSLYVAALSIGPAPVVVALHLASPIMLLTLAVMSGRRSATVWIAVEAVLLAVAIAMVSAGGAAGETAARTVLGCVLALGSAAAVTALILVVAREAGRRDPVVSAGLQMAMAALCMAPMLLTRDWSVAVAGSEILLGALFLGPGFALYWRALGRVSAPTAGVVGLNEALVASVVIAMVDRAQISHAVVGAALLVTVAILLDIRQRDR